MESPGGDPSSAVELTLVMPAHDEEGIIEKAVRDAVATLRALVGEQHEMIVVDDASSDATPEILQRLQREEPTLRVITLERNLGHGPALRTGLEASTGKWVAHLDSDDEIPAESLVALWQERDHADLVLGVRTGRRSPPARRFVTASLRLVARLAARRPIADANTPCKIIRRDVLAPVMASIPPDAFAPSVLLVVGVARAGRSIAEVPVATRDRAVGRSWLVPTRLFAGSLRTLLDTVSAAMPHDDPPTVPHDTTNGLVVLTALQYFTPHRTGLTLHVERLASSLVAAGHAVTVVTARHDRSCPRRAIESGVDVRRLWAPITISRGMIMPFHPVAMWRAMKPADVVLLHSPMLETPLVAVLCRLRRRPLVITHHGDLVLPSSRRNRLIERFVMAGWRRGARRAAAVVAYSDDYLRASAYLAPFVDRAVVITPPIEIPAPRPERVAARRAEWGGGPVIGFVGRFVEEKRPDVALRALDVVRAEHPTARLVFAGQHEITYEDTWRRHAALVDARRDHVSFLGVVDDPQELADVYAACDVLILPSDSECFALVQVEAMLCGTPVVASDIDGARVPVAETGMGLLASAGDPEAFGRAVLAVLADRGSFARRPSEVGAALRLDETVTRYERVLRDAARS